MRRRILLGTSSVILLSMFVFPNWLEPYEVEKEIVNSSFQSLAAEISEMSNESSIDFVNHFCKYRMVKAIYQPKICLFDNDYVSNFYARNGHYEQSHTATLMAHLEYLKSKNPSSNVIFFDVGSNIGTQTLPALSLGFTTYSVDVQKDAMVRLATAIKLNGFSAKSKLFHKPVSKNRECFTFHINSPNRGGSTVNSVPCQSKDAKATIVTLDDIAREFPRNKNLEIVMKMDIENHEAPAILGGLKLFSEKSVKILMIEYEHIKDKANSNKQFGDILDEALTFLVKNCSYDVFAFPGGQKLELAHNRAWSTWDIVFAQPGFWRGAVKTFEHLEVVRRYLM